MTPSQMIKRKPQADVPECCDVDLTPTSYDFAQGAKMSPYACLQQKTCPICGEKGTLSTIQGMHTSFFYCKDRAHIFEMDDKSTHVERIGR